MFCRKCLYPLEGIAAGDLEPGGRCPECGTDFDPKEPGTFLRRLEHPVDGVLRWFLLLAAAYPVAWMSLPYINYLLARWQLGRWPQDLEEGSTEWLTVLFVLGLLPCPLLALGAVVAVGLAVQRRLRGCWWAIVLLVATWMTAWALWEHDPGHIQNWCFD